MAMTGEATIAAPRYVSRLVRNRRGERLVDNSAL